MAEERWRDVPGYEGRYIVSDHGNMWSVLAWKPLRHHLDRHGRPSVKLSRNYHRRATYVSSLVLEAFTGPRPDGKECSHLDGDPLNNHISNLVWETREENMARKLEHGTLPWGERQWMSKLTKSDVRGVRRRLARGESYTSIGRKYGVNYQTIRDIRLGKTWRHLK